MSNIAENFLEKLCSHVKLERDKSIQELSQMQLTLDEIRNYETLFSNVILNENSSWESKQSCLICLKIIIDAVSLECYEKLKLRCVALLHDDEVRVRLAVGELIGAFCKRFGCEVYEYFGDHVLSYTRNNIIQRSISTEVEFKEADKLMEKFSGCQFHNSVEVEKSNVTRIFHDTAGWHHLETSVKALQCMIDGCGIQFAKYVDKSFMELIFKTLDHTNRFVQESGFYICAAVFACFMPMPFTTDTNPTVEFVLNPDTNNPELNFGGQLASYLALGLVDNWSQVRLAASVATRRFLLNVVDAGRRENYFTVLIPPLCFNRYHLAEGVRLYVQQTWAMVVGDHGPELVARYVDNVVSCYLDQSKSSNYTVRISSCQCIAELAQKINKDAVRPHVVQLLQTLFLCVNDTSWQVRDTALLACEKLVTNFPEQSQSHLETLLPLFFASLSDCIPLVCSGAAESLAKIIETYGFNMFSEILPKVKEGLKKVDEQKPSTGKSTNVQKQNAGPTNRMFFGKIDFHLSEQVTCTCGGTVAKSNQEEKTTVVKREISPWEVTDGCVQLTAELTTCSDTKVQSKIATELLPLIISAAQKRHFVEHVHLLETICRRLPQIAKNLNKKYFKPFLDDFIEPIFYALQCECTATENSAKDCIEELMKFFGANILKVKIEKINPKFLSLYQKEMEKLPH